MPSLSDSQRSLLPKASQTSLGTQYTEPEYFQDEGFLEDVQRTEASHIPAGPYRTDSMSTTTTISPSQRTNSLDGRDTTRGAGCLSWLAASILTNSSRSNKNLKRSHKTASSDERSAQRVRRSSRSPSTKKPADLFIAANVIAPEPVEDVTDVDFTLPCDEVADPVIIAHDKRMQAKMDKREIAWGVQLEIARGVTNGLWKWDDITDEMLDSLRGTNAHAMQLVHQTITGNPKEISSGDLNVFDEYDREQAAIMENEGRGLGLFGAYMGKEDWYGGRIQQIASLVEVLTKCRSCTDKKGRGRCERCESKYVVRLEKPESTRSHRLGRLLGSRRVLILRVDTEDVTRDRERIILFLSRKLVLCGRIFHAIHAKDGKVYFVEVDMDYERRATPESGDSFRFSWGDFIKLHNDLKDNMSQAISKWCTRWALFLSSSIPVVEFEEENIFRLDDEYATINPPKPSSAKAEQIMTDGCSYMNYAALRMIAEIMKCTSLPIAVQGRVQGSKGMWILHPGRDFHDPFQKPMIWIRNSQKKIKYHGLLTRSQRIFDLVRLSKLNPNGSLYMQTIMNLSYNGVPDSVFKDLMEEGLRAEIEPLTKWSEPQGLPALCKAVEGAGKVIGSRLSKIAGSKARAYGYAPDDDDLETDELWEHGLSNEAPIIERYDISGCPISLYESTIEMLQANFNPMTCPLLATKLNEIVNCVAKLYMSKHHIAVRSSIEAMLIPDPCDVLEEDEIFFRSSYTDNDNVTFRDFLSPCNVYTGRAILTRNPTRLASDAHMVTAVHHDCLLPYVDVIVCSKKGRRSIASYLGGGDYDGDKATLFMDSRIIDNFKKPAFVEEPAKFLERNFEKMVESVPNFLRRISRSAEVQENEVHKVLLRGLYDTKVGLYSHFHDLAVYMYGYNHTKTQRLAYMFMTELDSAKSGLRVKDEVFRRDRKGFPFVKPECMLTVEEAEKRRNPKDNLVEPKRHVKGTFIMQVLYDASIKLQNDLLSENRQLTEKVDQRLDRQLLAPIDEAERLSRLLQSRGIRDAGDDLEKIEKHVNDILQTYRAELRTIAADREKKTESRRSRPSVIQHIILDFESGPQDLSGLIPESLVASVKVAYAYKKGTLMRGILATAFPFDMAHSTLCCLKARSTGCPVSITDKFSALRTMHGTLCTRYTEYAMTEGRG